MFSGFMVNAWIVATMVAVVAGVVGFFTVLRGSAFVAHAVPQGRVRRRRGRVPARDQHLCRAGRIRRAERGGHRLARQARPPRRDDGARARVHAGARCPVPELERAIRVRDLRPALRRGARSQQQPGARDRSARRGVHLVRRRPVPPAPADLRGARGRRGPRGARSADGDVLPRGRGGGDDDVGARRRCPVDVQLDDRCSRCGPSRSRRGRLPPWDSPSPSR